ncbi:dynamin-related 3B-like isoform A [Chlorella sorokiniana]|uniref:cysteine dioxygenase n=1 Tax=Chlorella sorokiniana TaxID=3076 RepID=A0A2P6U1A4_CHLSO|nr:dynamin-related 3B-like isoform A [Chlorella sorokiniana]|eukprot:PRW60097.1 dynamin-related 3B-like isoform A [Chlorella sorokiniana]
MGTPSQPVRKSRLQFVFDLAHATFSQGGLPTAAQIDALRRTLSQVPLEELGLQQEQQQEVASSSSSRSSSPGLSGGLTAAAAQQDQQAMDREAAADAARPPITYLLIYEDSRVSMGIFCLPARARIPLHNHPGMTVLSRVLYGRMHVCSYDWAQPEVGPDAPLPRRARVVLDATLTAGDQPAILFPSAGGNIHEFTALTDCAVLDLMSPPYSTDEGRDCTYYAVVEEGGQAQQQQQAALQAGVLLDSFEPPADFVINQGHYRGLQPRPKLLPFFQGSSPPRAGGRDLSPAEARAAAVKAAAAKAAAAACAAPPVLVTTGVPAIPQPSPPGSLSPLGSPPISSPVSEVTGVPKFGSLLDSGSGLDGSVGHAQLTPRGSHSVAFLASGSLGESIIPAINKLQDVFSQLSADVKLDLPQIAVVGSQSSGKSSVLEALVGRDFLPRGSNIVTRRPLILQLVKTQPAGGQYAEWGEFLHNPGKRFYDFDRIRQEILTETERVVGSNKGISEKPIRLKIYSPNVLTMTLVDLPGITRVPVGDQPSDIEARLRAMILEYIKAPSCLILAVSPANQDIVNSDALDMARQVDPEGRRTIGVLTKLDIMDRGTDAVAVLKNEAVPLALGFVGVVLRSQEDIANRRSMADARSAERAFFESHPEYMEVAPQCGVGHLARVLNTLLVDHIRGLLPSLRNKIEDAIAARRRELSMYGDAPPGSSSAARGGLLLTILDQYASRFSAMLDGRSEHMPVSELAGGARIRHIFQEIFNAGLEELDPTSELTDDDVRTAIKNSGGIKGSLLIPEAPFELLVRRAIERLLPPALQCKDFVHSELLRIASQCAPPEVKRFQILGSLLSEAVEEFISAGTSPAEQQIRNLVACELAYINTFQLVACELAYINTSHPQFIGGNRAIAQVLERRGVASGSEDEGGSTAGGANGRDATAPHKSKSTSALPAGGAQQAQRTGGLAAAAKAALRGVEPELFNPEDLLAATGGLGPDGDRAVTSGAAGVAASSPRPGLASIPNDAAQKGSWFSNWFGSTRGALDETASDPGADDGALRRPPPTLRVPKAVSDQEGVQVEVTRLLVASYFDIVRKNLQDGVPKALMHFMVNNVQRGLQQHLIRKLYREELFEAIMEERQDIAAKRNQCQEALRALRAAQATLEGLPAELLGRVNQSGRWSFKQMLADMPGGGGDGRSPPKADLNGVPGGFNRRLPAAAATQQQLSAAQKAAMQAVSLLSGGIAAHR